MSAYPCECGGTHMSALAQLWCAEQIEADDKAARRGHVSREKDPLTYVLGYD